MWLQGEGTMEQTKAGNPKSSALLLGRIFGLSTADTDPRTEFVPD